MSKPLYGCPRTIYISINPDKLVISRCCNFRFRPENHFEIGIDDLPSDDNELKKLILDCSKMPSTFKELSFPEDKNCEAPCKLIFNEKAVSVSIDITGCNLKCVMCNFRNSSYGSKMKEILYRLYSIFIEDGSFNIETTSIGEPFLNKDLIYRALEKNIWVKVISNLTLINAEDISKLMGKSISITSSVDSVNEEIYRKIRVPADHDTFIRVLSNAKILAKLGLLHNNDITITSENLDYDDLVNTYDWFNRLGVTVLFGVDNNKRTELLNSPIVKRLQNKYPNNWRI